MGIGTMQTGALNELNDLGLIGCCNFSPRGLLWIEFLESNRIELLAILFAISEI